MSRQIIGLSILFLVVSSPVAAEDRPRTLTLMNVVELTLEHDPIIQIEQNSISQLEGVLTTSKGSFDPTFRAGVDWSDTETPTSETAVNENRTLTSSAEWSQRLRSGQTLSPSLELDQTAGNPNENTATVSFTVRQPLWQGRKSDVVTATERIAELNLDAGRLDLSHSIASRILAVVSQYWRVKTALDSLEILRSSEESTRNLLANTRKLVEAQLTPAAELVQLEADLVSREINRIAGEGTLFQAIQTLGEQIGLEAEEIAVLPWPAADYPTVQSSAVPEHPKELVSLAVLERSDLRADQQRIQAAEVRLMAAEDTLAPRLDFVMTPSYRGYVDGSSVGDFFAPLYENVPGLSVNFSLSYSFPLGNNVAAGQALSARSGLRQSELNEELLRTQIGARVPSALDTVRRTAIRLEKLERGVELFTRTLENEEKKLRAGTSTLIDVISQRDRLISSQQLKTRAEADLAIALIQLRFETGTLMEDVQDGRGQTRLQNLVTLPN